MRGRRRSSTAELAAAMRALHGIVDDEPRVLDDPYAVALLGPVLGPALRGLEAGVDAWRAGRDQRLAAPLSRWLRRRVPTGERRLRAQLVTRSRYAEDALAQALERGVEQYVVLAAGLDTFALRRGDLANRLRVFEVDHPLTQEWKRERIEAVAGSLPSNLELVPVDFERESTGEALERSGYRQDHPAFFSWLGVSYYLSRAAIEETLALVALQADGSELVLDHYARRVPAVVDRLVLDAIRLGVAAQGEAMLSLLEPDELAALARRAGLRVVEHLDAAATERRYLLGRRDGLRVPTFAHLARLAR